MKKSFIKRLVAMALVIVSAMAITLPAMAAVSVPNGTSMWVYRGGLNFRETPSTSADRIEQIPNHMPVIKLSTTGIWSRIFYNGHYGYVQSEFLTDTPSGYTKPVNENMAFGNDTLSMKTTSVKNHHVYNLQQCLRFGGYLYDSPDGFFGVNTKAAVIQFQKDVNENLPANAKIAEDGIVGPDTRGYLWDEYESYMRTDGVLSLPVY